jgi:hypothetical protein
VIAETVEQVWTSGLVLAVAVLVAVVGAALRWW